MSRLPALSSSDSLSPSAALSQPRIESRRLSRIDRDSTWASDGLLADLTPDAILETLTPGDSQLPESTAHRQLKASIENASPFEKEVAIRAAIVAKSLKSWVLELEGWDWPGSSGFEPPKEAQGYTKDTGYYAEDKTYLSLQGGRHGSDGFVGAFSASVVKEHEDRIRSIRKDIEDLGVENLKEHALDAHVSSRSRPSSSYSQETSFSALSSYTRLDDITALITATTLQALPHLSHLYQMMNIWTIRLLVLRKVPTFLNNYWTVKNVLRSGWSIIEELEAETHSSSSNVIHAAENYPEKRRPTFTRKEFSHMRSTLQEQVGRLGEELDSMLDALEGHEDTVPDLWIDNMEAIEAEYSRWVEEAENSALKYELRESRARNTSSSSHMPLSHSTDGALDEQGSKMTLNLDHQANNSSQAEHLVSGEQRRTDDLRRVPSAVISDEHVHEPSHDELNQPTSNTLPAPPEPSSIAFHHSRTDHISVSLSKSDWSLAEASSALGQQPHVNLPVSPAFISPTNFSISDVHQAQSALNTTDFPARPTHDDYEMEVDSLTDVQTNFDIKSDSANASSDTLYRQLELLNIGGSVQQGSSSQNLSKSLETKSHQRPEVPELENPHAAVVPKLGSPWVSPVRHKRSGGVNTDGNMKYTSSDSMARYDPQNGSTGQVQREPPVELTTSSSDNHSARETLMQSSDMADVVPTLLPGSSADEVQSSKIHGAGSWDTHTTLATVETPDIVLENADARPQNITGSITMDVGDSHRSYTDYFSQKRSSHLSPEVSVLEHARASTKTIEKRPASSGGQQISRLPKLRNSSFYSNSTNNVSPERDIGTAYMPNNDSFSSNGGQETSKIERWSKENLSFNFSSLPPSRKVSFEGTVPRSSSTRKSRISEASSKKPSAIPRPSFGSGDLSPSLRYSGECSGIPLPRMKPPITAQAIVPSKHKSIEDLRLASAKRLRRQPSATESLSDVASRDIQIKPVTNVDENLDRKIKSILHSLNGTIRLHAGGESNSPDVAAPKGKPQVRALRPQRSFSGNSAFSTSRGSGSDALARSPGDNEIRLYHLQRTDREAPIKLYIRPVGDHSERVMVRVGGGWADLSEYLKEYANHHGRRSASAGGFDNQHLARNSPLSSSMTSDGRSSPLGRPPMISERPRSSLGIKKTRSRLSEATSTVQGQNIAPSTPQVLTPDRVEATPQSASSISSRLSYKEDESGLGLAGPKSRKHEMSAEKQAWVDRMMEQAKGSGSDKKKKKKSDWGELGRIGGTRRIFLRGKNERP